jgi:hypothetical protein
MMSFCKEWSESIMDQIVLNPVGGVDVVAAGEEEAGEAAAEAKSSDLKSLNQRGPTRSNYTMI